VRLPERVTIVDVGPRDGLQSLPRTYPLETKLEMISLLAGAGLPKIEVTAFVRPDVVPQLADAEDLLAGLGRVDGCVFRALVPNRRGAERAAAAGVDEMLALVTASETYNLRNSRMRIAENLDEVAAIAALARESRTGLVVAIGVAMFCPYEGDIPEQRVLDMIDRMRSDGVEEVYVATSAGLDGPLRVAQLCSRILERWPDLRLGVHLHNTNGMALANALAAADAGVTVFEGAVCGIGGGLHMPRGLGHYGNVATEDLVQLFAELGVDTGVDFPALLAAAERSRELLGLERVFSYALQGGTKQAAREQAHAARPPAG
jgi:hydroxymethylglutaryl-CoA lyase